MKIAKALLQLVRFPNLVFIFITQYAAYTCLIFPTLDSLFEVAILQTPRFYYLLFSTLCIAAAGYIINDYFDIGMDAINKPEKVTIERIFKRRTIIVWHILLNMLGLVLAAYIAFTFLQLRWITIQLLCIIALVVYSTTFKRKLVIGNVLIASLSSLAMLTLAWYEPNFPLLNTQLELVRYFWFYTVFAFFITLLREIVKDMEDIKGDGLQNCKTIPLVWGIQMAKTILYAVAFLIECLLVYLLICVPHPSSLFVYYLLFTVGLPLLAICILIYRSKNTRDFHTISTSLKYITLAGILSIFFHLL